MANLSDFVRMSPLDERLERAEDIEQIKEIVLEMTRRFDMFAQSVVGQLKVEPTVFAVNPDEDTEAIEGFKSGTDIAVWVDSNGSTQLRVLV